MDLREGYVVGADGTFCKTDDLSDSWERIDEGVLSSLFALAGFFLLYPTSEHITQAICSTHPLPSPHPLALGKQTRE